MERSLRKEDSHERKVPETPKDKCRRCNNISWSNISSCSSNCYSCCCRCVSSARFSDTPEFIAPFLENVTVLVGASVTFQCHMKSNIQPHIQVPRLFLPGAICR